MQLLDPQFTQNYDHFNNTSADLALMSADVLLNMMIILSELGIAQLSP